WNDIDPTQAAHDLMTRTVGLGTRRLPSGWEGTVAVAAAGLPAALAAPAAVVQTAAGVGNNLDVQPPLRLAEVAPPAVSGLPPPCPMVPTCWLVRGQRTLCPRRSSEEPESVERSGACFRWR